MHSPPPPPLRSFILCNTSFFSLFAQVSVSPVYFPLFFSFPRVGRDKLPKALAPRGHDVRRPAGEKGDVHWHVTVRTCVHMHPLIPSPKRALQMLFIVKTLRMEKEKKNHTHTFTKGVSA